MTDLEIALKAVADLLAQADDGPEECVAVRSNGTWTWKVSFKTNLERLRLMVTPSFPPS